MAQAVRPRNAQCAQPGVRMRRVLPRLTGQRGETHAYESILHDRSAGIGHHCNPDFARGNRGRASRLLRAFPNRRARICHGGHKCFHGLSSGLHPGLR